MGLIPELRADKNGKMVTRHVRTGAPAASLSKLPAPQLASKKTPEPKASTKQKRHEMVAVRYANKDLLKKVQEHKKMSFIAGLAHFECSDEEAYSVLSVAGFDNTLSLLDAGVRTKYEALDFLTENNLEYLIEDNSELVQEAINRKMAAIPAIEGFKTANPERPTYYDAAEAYSIKAFRDMTTAMGYNIPFLVTMDEISLSDLKHIGVTRVCKAEKTMMMGITKELKAIHDGTSKYDIETLKKLIIMEEKFGNSLSDTVMMANEYGADFIFDLSHYGLAVSNNDRMSKSGRTDEEKAGIIKLADEMWSRKVNMAFDDLVEAYDAGITADKLDEGLDNKMTVKQIIAMHSGIESSLTSGWL